MEFINRAEYLQERKRLSKIVSKMDVEMESCGNLSKAITATFGRDLLLLFIPTLINNLSRIFYPFLVFRLISLFAENRIGEGNSQLLVYSVLLFTCDMVQTICEIYFQNKIGKIQNEIISALHCVLYKKILRMPDLEANTSSVTSIVTSDCMTVGRFILYIFDFPSNILTVIVSFSWLFILIGWSSLITIFVMFAILLPANYISLKYCYGKNKTLKEKKDERIDLTRRAILNIRTIKSFFWESFYNRKIQGVRDEEVELSIASSISWCVNRVMSYTAVLLLCSGAYSLFVIFGNKLETAVYFTLISATGSMVHPVLTIVDSYNFLYLFRISKSKIEDFLSIEEVTGRFRNGDDDEYLIKLKNSSFGWDFETTSKKEKQKNSSAVVVDNVSLEIRKGEFILLYGPVGSSKTSLVNAILGEMKQNEGSIFRKKNSPIPFFSQKHWMRSKSIRENITMNYQSLLDEEEKERYEDILRCVCLDQDLQKMSDGDMTCIGERGMKISGGQRARVELARCCYLSKDSEICIFDCPTKDLDSNVAKNVFKNVFLEFLGDKTRVLVTHNPDFLKFADRVITMKEGRIDNIIENSKQKIHQYDVFDYDEENEGEEVQEEKEEEEKDVKKIEEKKKKVVLDRFNLRLLMNYLFQMKSHFLGFGLLLLLKGLVEVFHDLFINKWLGDNDFKIHSLWYYVSISLFLGSMVVALVSTSQIFYQYYMIQNSNRLHQNMLSILFRATISFFDRSSLIGDILSKFTRDIDTLDNDLRWMFREFSTWFSYFIITILFLIYLLPWFSLLLIPIGLFGYKISKTYLQRYVLLCKAQASLQSPVLDHINETIMGGLITIRAYHLEESMQRELMEKIEEKTLVSSYGIDTNSRMNFFTKILCVVSAFLFMIYFAIFSSDDFENVGPIVGLGISKLLGLKGILSFLIFLFAGIQKSLASLERVQDFMKTTELENYSIGKKVQRLDGGIKFDNVSFRYKSTTSDHNNYVLRNISFQIKPRQRVAFVGRTGAGKSTIVKLLLRWYDIKKNEGGRILVNNVIPIEAVSLSSIRTKIVHIDQNPVVINPTLRENLDPERKFDDFEIWKSLEICGLKDKLSKNLGVGLDCDLGSLKLSCGELQLLQISRALLFQKDVLVLDEASSQTDLETDKRIQDVIREFFRDRMVVCIAHRVSTILDFDIVFVVDNGKIVERGVPKVLFRDHSSKFFELCKNNSM